MDRRQREPRLGPALQAPSEERQLRLKTRRRRTHEVCGAALFLCCVATANAAPVAHLTLHSEPGDFIGQGKDFSITYTPATSVSFFPEIRRAIGAPPGQPAELLFVLGTTTSGPDNTFVLLFFGTDQLGIPMQPGVYEDAERADFATPGHPGLDIEFQNRGCNIVTGRFSVEQATFGTDSTGAPTIRTFAATFEQHCEGAVPALFGTFTFDANPPPAPVPVSPVSSILAIAIAAFAASRRLSVCGRLFALGKRGSNFDP